MASDADLFSSFCSMAGGDCQQLALTPDFTPQIPCMDQPWHANYASYRAIPRATTLILADLAKPRGKAQMTPVVLPAQICATLLLELGDGMLLEAYGILCFDVIDAISNILIWYCQPWY
jgi:hypothetical protein